MTDFVARSFTRFCLAAALAASPALLTGCGGPQQYVMTGTDEAPGADARVEVEAMEHGNVEILIEVENLLPPSRATKGARRYGIWLRHGERAAVHLGNLAYDDEERAGVFSGITPYKTFDLTITAEKSDHPDAPSKDVVLKQTVSVK